MHLHCSQITTYQIFEGIFKLIYASSVLKVSCVVFLSLRVNKPVKLFDPHKLFVKILQ